MNNRTMLPVPKNNEVAGYRGPVKIELLKGAGLLIKCCEWKILTFLYEKLKMETPSLSFIDITENVLFKAEKNVERNLKTSVSISESFQI